MYNLYGLTEEEITIVEENRPEITAMPFWHLVAAGQVSRQRATGHWLALPVTFITGGFHGRDNTRFETRLAALETGSRSKKEIN